MGCSRLLQLDGIRMNMQGSSRHSATNSQWWNNRSQLFRAQTVEISVEERKVTNSTSVGKWRKSSSKTRVINKSDGFPLDGIEDTKCRRWCRSPHVRTIFQTRSYLGYVKSIQIQRRKVPSSPKEESKLFSSWCGNWFNVSVPAKIMFESNTNKIERFLIL